MDNGCRGPQHENHDSAILSSADQTCNTYAFVNAPPKVEILTRAMRLSSGVLLHSFDACFVISPVLAIGDDISV